MRSLIVLGAACALAGCKRPAPPPPSESPPAARQPAGWQLPSGPIAAPRDLSAADRAAYKAALAEGRRASKGGDYAAAARAFQRALGLLPDDPAALSELGVATFQAEPGGDLARAEAITRRALAAAKDPRLQAASHYNLGLLLERRGDRAGAAAAFLRALELRPSRAAREALARLDPAAAAARDPLRPAPLLGPFPDLRALCASLGEDNRDPARCPDEDFKGEELDGPTAPFLGARLFKDGGDLCRLAVRTAAGWFHDGGTPCDSQSQISVDSLEVEALTKGGPKQLVLRRCDDNLYREDVEGDDGQTLRPLVSHTARALLVCGVGPSGKPSCAEIPTAGGGEGCGKRDRFRWRIVPTFTATAVDIKVKGKADSDTAALAGSHPLAFP